MTRSMAIPPTDQENALADQILLHTQCHQTGELTAEAAVEVFNRSGLSRYELRDIWGLADADSNGVLSKEELIVALRVMGWVQSGKVFVEALVDKPGPLPTIQGIAIPKLPEMEPSASTSSLASSSTPSYQTFPSLLPVDLRRFREEYKNAGPVDGCLEGDAVREIYMKSDLSYNQLSGIWTLVDTKRAGRLTFPEFAMGMYLIDALKSCRLSAVPTSLPPYLFEQFEEVSDLPADRSSQSPFLTPSITRLATSQRPPIPVKSPSLPPKPKPPPPPKPLKKPWIVTPAEKSEYDAEFAILDTEGTGLVSEEEALAFLRRYQLPGEELVQIWDLSAIRNDHSLNSDEFAVAMHLMADRLTGKGIPLQLPLFLIPPSLRSFSSPNSPQLSKMSSASSSPKDRAPEPGQISFTNGLDSGLKRHRLARSSISQLSGPPISEPGPPLSPPELHRSSTSKISLTFLTENPTPAKQKPNKRRTSSNATTPDDDPLEELRMETKTLRRQIDNLLEQLSSQNEYRNANEQLRVENGVLKTKIGELESSMASVLTQMQSNDNALSDELTQEIDKLTRRVGELEQTETQLQQTVGILEVSKRDNALLTTQIRDLRNAESTHKADVEAAKHAMEELERETTYLKARLNDVTKAMSEPETANSSRELRVLLKDVTRENQTLKGRVREMEGSMEQLLLSSRGTTRVDELQRENRELRLQIQDLEQVTAQLQSTHEDSHLQQVLVAMARENEGMKVTIRDMQSGAAQLRAEGDARVAEMQRRVEELVGQNSSLKAQLRAGRTASRGEDMSVPPPAYDDDMFIPPE